jgi:2-dehydro-3-deoxyphosphooctonate aldolase (KDO 8-P synthase)
VPVTARIGKLTVGDGGKPLLIAGPCVIESEALTLSIAETIAKLPIIREFQFVFKASFTKDNRSAGESFRGPGIQEGLRILEKVRSTVGCPILSDVHSPEDVTATAPVLDVMQIPAFLCRQTSLIEAAGASGKPVNIKKGQFLAPEDMRNVVDKIKATGACDVLLTERGTSFGYHDLVVDFRGFARMRATGCPVIYDVTHSLQRPGGLGAASGGEPALAAMMARAAAAIPVDGLFIETHPDPSQAKSDAASMLPLAQLPALLEAVARIMTAARETGAR